jgi:hypothetical protein
MCRSVALRFLCIFSIALLFLQRESNAVVRLNQSRDCIEGKCSYLPLIVKPVPIVVLSAWPVIFDRSQHVFVFGEIQNTTHLPITNIVLRTKIYLFNELIRDIQHTTILPATLPGQINWYRVDADASANPDNIRTEVEVLTSTINTSGQFRNLTIENIATGLWKDIYVPGNTVTVTIRNPYTQTIQNVNILVWTSDTQGSTLTVFPCGRDKCSDFVSAVLPGQTHTTTLNWRTSSFGEVVSPNVIRVVAQGAMSP